MTCVLTDGHCFGGKMLRMMPKPHAGLSSGHKAHAGNVTGMGVVQTPEFLTTGPTGH